MSFWVNMGPTAKRWIILDFPKFKSVWPLLRGIRSLLIIVAALVSGCATTDDPYPGLDSTSRYYRVRKGDTIYGISKHVGRAVRLIAQWNGISAPFRIYDGQMIRLFPPPEPPAIATSGKLAEKKIARKPGFKKAGTQSVKRNDQTTAAPIKNESSSIPKSAEKKLKVFWSWPLKGVIAKNYSQTGRKGLDIAGKFGDPVRAAADGKIVYCGQGLIGYGNLVIVQHNAHFLSAYGNNSRLLVREGDFVKMGQRIAEVGMGADKQPVLHFQIRKDGKPINPIQHLPNP